MMVDNLTLRKMDDTQDDPCYPAERRDTHEYSQR